MDKGKVGFKEVAETAYRFRPKEKALKIQDKANFPISVGIPAELSEKEKRVSLKPQTVALLTANGMAVRIESQAGAQAGYQDAEYSEAGAQIIYHRKKVFESEIVLKVSPPTLEEIDQMHNGKALISALPHNAITTDYLHALNRKKITALAYEFIQDKVGELPLVRVMSEVAGSSAMLIAAELLSSFHYGQGIVPGGVTGVPPAKVLILGAGTVGEYAARAAIGLGAAVKIFDFHLYKLRRIKENLPNHAIHTSLIDTVALTEALRRTDIAIGAVRAEGGSSICIVTEEMVSQMKPKAIIIDVSIDQGGIFETSQQTTHFKPTFIKHGVLHYCVPNIGSRVARTASMVISNVFSPILLKIQDKGGIDKMLFHNPGFTKGVYTYRGNVTNEKIALKLRLPCKNLNLIIAAQY